LGYTGFRVSEVQCALAEGFASIVEGEKEKAKRPTYTEEERRIIIWSLLHLVELKEAG
jgi:hypothetical protein